MDFLQLKFVTPNLLVPVRVTIRSKSITLDMKQPFRYDKYVELLLDDGNSSIYAHVIGNDLQQIADLLEFGRTYVVNQYKVTSTRVRATACRNDFILLIDSIDAFNADMSIPVPVLPTISDLRNIRLLEVNGTFETIYVQVNAHLVEIDMNRITYNACPDAKCRKGVRNETFYDTFHCWKGCKKEWDHYVDRYSFGLTLFDETGVMFAMCFEEGGHSLLGRSGRQFEALVDNDPFEATDLMFSPVGKRFKVLVQIKHAKKLSLEDQREIEFIVHRFTPLEEA